MTTLTHCNEPMICATDKEIDDYIVRLLTELRMTRCEFLNRLTLGTEPDTFAAMALKALFLYD